MASKPTRVWWPFFFAQMPWDAGDASRHTSHAGSDTKKRQWSDVANSMLKRGKSEGAAVRAANAVVHYGRGKGPNPMRPKRASKR